MIGDSQVTLDPTSYRQVDQTSLFTPTAKSNSLGRNEFMTLLVKQMENQDPLEPVKDEQFIAQLATFSSLEQLVDLNSRIDSVINGQEQLINSQALSLIGREVIADTGGMLRLGPKGADTIVADFAAAPAGARVEIVDKAGKTVRTIQIENPTAGRNEVKWDGKDAQGHQLDQGDYKFKIISRDSKGAETPVGGYVSLLVEGIHVGRGGISIVSGDRSVSFANVIEIRAPDAPSTPGA